MLLELGKEQIQEIIQYGNYSICKYCHRVAGSMFSTLYWSNLQYNIAFLLYHLVEELVHFALQSMIELSRTQDEQVGDGTTSVIILGEWLLQ